MYFGLNKKGIKLGVVGLGGLGHMAVKFGVVRSLFRISYDVCMDAHSGKNALVCVLDFLLCANMRCHQCLLSDIAMKIHALAC